MLGRSRASRSRCQTRPNAASARRENVLINGQRINNKNYSGGWGRGRPTQRTPPGNVHRIEIVDTRPRHRRTVRPGRQCDLGKATQGSGQFEWDPISEPILRRPAASAARSAIRARKARSTIPFRSRTSRPRRYGGQILIYDLNRISPSAGTRSIIPNMTRDLPGKVQARRTRPLRRRPNAGLHALLGPGVSRGPTRMSPENQRPPVRRQQRLPRRRQQRLQIRIGPGRLKLIGLRHWRARPVRQHAHHVISTASPSEGQRFTTTPSGETIGRAEYHWKAGRNDWQVSLERAFNSLDQKGGLFELASRPAIHEQPFPGGTGNVAEIVRRHGDAQPAALREPRPASGGRRGMSAARPGRQRSEPARNFFRPKGSVKLGWRPAQGWDTSLKCGAASARSVLRLHLAAAPEQGRENRPTRTSSRRKAGEPRARSLELGKMGEDPAAPAGLQRPGRRRLIPIGDDTQGIGNLPRADRYGFESTSTSIASPIGWTGAKLDVTVGSETTGSAIRSTDESGHQRLKDRGWALNSPRHPATQIAWGAEVQYRTSPRIST